MIVGEAWGENERARNLPFVGASGKELEIMLAEAGIDPAQCFYTNLINEKPNANDMRAFLLPNQRGEKGLFNDGVRPSDRLLTGLQRLDRQIEAVKPQIIITVGNWPMWYLTGKGNVKTAKGYKLPTGIDTWRGSQLFLRPSPFRDMCDIPVLPVYHPAAILRNYSWRKITVQDLTRATDFLEGTSWKDLGELDRLNIVMPSPAELGRFIDSWIKQPEIPIVCDLETKQFRIHIVGLTQDGKTNIAIPFFHITANGFRPTYQPLAFRQIYMHLHRLFHAPGMRFRGQNWMYDIQFITMFFFTTPVCDWDSMIGQHVAFPALRKALDYQASMYCKHYVYWKDDLKESTDNMDTTKACLYNCEDLWRTHEIIAAQEIMLPALGKLSQFHRRMRVFPVLVKMMNNGVLVNKQMKERQRTQLFHTALEISNWLEEVMPDRVKDKRKGAKPWFSSNAQLAPILYDRLKLKPIINRKTGTRSTDKEALVALSERYPQWSGLLSAILLYRSVRVVAGNILSSKLEVDGRIRTSYSLAGPDTYRLSSSKNVWDGGGNLQNIMRDREDMDLLEQDLI